MKARQIFSFIVIVAVLALILLYVNSGKKNSGNTISPVGELSLAPESIGGIGIEGTGGDALLNKEKNRYTAPTTPSDLSVAQVRSIPSALLTESGRSKRAYWSRESANYVGVQEHRGVRITGYLIHAKESGPESCNGYSDSLRDYHIWISDVPTNDKADGIIVEITPRWKLVHPEWRLHAIERLAQQHAHVRVTGWLMWDEEHPDEVGKSRGSQWEVHPVTNFEVEAAGGWRALGAE